MRDCSSPSSERHIRLAAVDQQRNIARRYDIDLEPDLFGRFIVTWSWGRLGSQGRQRAASFDDTDAANRFVGRLLARRRSAVKRIGIGYRQIAG